MSRATQRRAWRRTDDYTPGTPKVQLVTEDLALPLDPTAVLVKVHAVSLNFRDANIANGGNPWPVIPHGILGNDAAGEVVAVGEKVKEVKVGDRVLPVTDTGFITGREGRRSWLAADEDGVLADHVVFDETHVSTFPDYLEWTRAATIPCAGTTAWSAIKGAEIGQTVLIQGTGGVSMFALKLARHMGLRVVLTSGSDAKLEQMKQKFTDPPILTVNYKNPKWHEEVLRLTDDIGVDIVIENGGTASVIPSMKCTRRGGIVSQVGYLGKQDPQDLKELISTIIDRRIIYRGINAGSKYDMQDLAAALTATRIQLDDLIDTVFPFDKAEEAIEYVWQGKQIGKIVISLDK